MKRNIIATIGFFKGTVTLTVLEKLSTSVFEIFNAEGSSKTSNSFLKESIAKVEKLIGGKLTKVNVVIEPAERVGAKTALAKKTLSIAGGAISIKDIDNAIELINKETKSDKSIPVLVQPIKFEVHDVMTKSYKQAPISKQGNKMTVTAAVTSISIETHDYIQAITRSQDLEINQILLTTQSISQNHLSESALDAGAVLIHVSEHQTFVSINKHMATLAHMSIYDYGFKNLVNGIVKIFNCTPQEARDLVSAHASFNDTDNKIIYTRQNGLIEEIFTTRHLSKIINKFMSNMMLAINGFLRQKNVKDVPIVISGKVWKIEAVDKFIKNHVDAEYVSVYNPLTFVEMNEKNINALGIYTFTDNLRNIMGRNFDTIVETNPSSMDTLRVQNKPKWFEKIASRLGGNHDWK